MSVPYTIGEDESSVAVAGRTEPWVRRTAEATDRGEATVDASREVLPRAPFLRHAACAIREAGNQSDSVTLLLVSLDGFAGLREAIGPQLADQLLTAVGERLRVCLRGADDVVGQLADGQFGICLAGEAESAMILGNCIQRALEVPFAGHGHELLIRASLGLVAVPRAARAF